MSDGERHTHGSLQPVADTTPTTINVHDFIIDSVARYFFDSVKILCVHVVSHQKEAAALEQQGSEVALIKWSLEVGHETGCNVFILLTMPGR